MILAIIMLVAVIVVAAVAYVRLANHGYPRGKNLFKNSADCLDEKQDAASDYDYWNKNKVD